jgi:hypothetical protein
MGSSWAGLFRGGAVMPVGLAVSAHYDEIVTVAAVRCAWLTDRRCKHLVPASTIVKKTGYRAVTHNHPLTMRIYTMAA